MIAIELFDANDFVVDVELDGVSYALHWAWNSENGFWTWGVQNADGIVQFEGLRVLANVDLLRGLRHLDVPQGWLYVDCDGDLNRDAFVNGRAELVYVGVNESVENE